MSTRRSTKSEGEKKPLGRPPMVFEKDRDGVLVSGQDGGLTAMQRAFVGAFVLGGETGGNPTKAALAAGYSPSGARTIAADLLTKPHVIAAIDAELRSAIGNRLTVKAVGVIEAILDSKEASLKLKGDMAAQIIQFSGLVERTKAQRSRETGIADKPLGECSRSELEEIVRKGALVLQAAASLPAGPVIEGNAQDSAQRPDITDEKPA